MNKIIVLDEDAATRGKGGVLGEVEFLLLDLPNGLRFKMYAYPDSLKIELQRTDGVVGLTVTPYSINSICLSPIYKEVEKCPG